MTRKRVTFADEKYKCTQEMARRPNINKNKINIKHLNKEIEDWYKVDKVFGDTFNNNVYWALREKCFEKDEFLDKIIECEHLISEIKASIKMAEKVVNEVKAKQVSATKNNKLVTCSMDEFKCYMPNSKDRYVDHLKYHKDLGHSVYEQLNDEGRVVRIEANDQEPDEVFYNDESEDQIPPTQPSQQSQSLLSSQPPSSKTLSNTDTYSMPTAGTSSQSQSQQSQDTTTDSIFVAGIIDPHQASTQKQNEDDNKPKERKRTRTSAQDDITSDPKRVKDNSIDKKLENIQKQIDELESDSDYSDESQDSISKVPLPTLEQSGATENIRKEIMGRRKERELALNKEGSIGSTGSSVVVLDNNTGLPLEDQRKLGAIPKKENISTLTKDKVEVNLDDTVLENTLVNPIDETRLKSLLDASVLSKGDGVTLEDLRVEFH